MPRLLKTKLLIAATLVAFPGFGQSTSAEPAARWWSHMQVLASDDLEGRMTGAAGHRKAVEYAVEQFEKAGLKPGGTRGYLQPIELVSRQIDEQLSKLELVRNGKADRLDFAEDGYITPAPDSAAQLEAPLVFIGYGLTIPEAGIQDLKGRDLKGKVVVFLSGAPSSVLGPLSAHAQSARERWTALREAGAVGYSHPGSEQHGYSLAARREQSDPTDDVLCRFVVE